MVLYSLGAGLCNRYTEFFHLSPSSADKIHSVTLSDKKVLLEFLFLVPLCQPTERISVVVEYRKKLGREEVRTEEINK
jgi:hypothetical protein